MLSPILARSLTAALLLAVLCLGSGVTRPAHVGAGAPASGILGDADCSGAVNPIDSLIILRNDAGLAAAPCVDLADVQCDDDVDPVDSLQVLRFDAGLAVTQQPDCTAIGEPLGPPPTSEELIAAALAANEITYEESLLERAYALYADPRQDPRFASPIIEWEAESELDQEIEAHEGELSQDLLTALAPFRARPNDPISIFNQPLGAAAAPQGPALTWQSKPVPSTNARVWAKTTPDDDLGPFVNAVIAAWSAMGPSPGETALMRYPTPDEAETPNAEINPDTKIDFYLIDRTTVDPRSAFCAANPTDENCTLATLEAAGAAKRAAPKSGYTSSAYLLVNEALSGDRLIGTVAHELAHASQFSYDNQEVSWLYESTAAWVEHHALKRLSKFPLYPYDAVRELYPLLDTRLTTDDDQHKYGSWLFFYFASMNMGDGIVTSVWEHAALPNVDGIVAVDEAFNLDDNFDDFTVRNWNRDPVPDLYKTKDDTFPPGFEPETEEHHPAPADVYPLIGPVPPLAAQYYSFEFPADVRKVRFENLVKNIPTAHVWAIPQIDFTWQPPEDWSEESEKEFCRDLPEEDLTKLVLIFSNSDIQPNGPPLPTVSGNVHAEKPGCQGWKGFAHSTFVDPFQTFGTATVTNDADLFWEYHDPNEEGATVYYPCELDPDPCLLYIPKGDIDWHYSYVRTSDPACSEEYFGTVQAGHIIIRSDQELLLQPDGAGGYTYSGAGFDPTLFIPLSCQVTSDYAPVHFFQAPESEMFEVSADGLTIAGSYHFEVFGEGGNPTFDYNWQFHYLGDPP